jgi:hypothetical protein
MGPNGPSIAGTGTQLTDQDIRSTLEAVRDRYASDITTGEPLDRPIRQYPPAGKTTASEALEEDRAER